MQEDWDAAAEPTSRGHETRILHKKTLNWDAAQGPCMKHHLLGELGKIAQHDYKDKLG
jgi:hypothetical protein